MGSPRTCAIIGAGMAGLVAAERLERAGLKVTVFEKSPRQGGRIATRQTRVAQFDHGAPGIEAETPEFAAFLEGLGAIRGADGRFRGPNGMRSVFDPLTSRLRIKWQVTASRLERFAGHWFVLTESGGRHGPFDRVALTAPAPQSARIIDGAAPDISHQVASVAMEPVWTGMMSFERPIRLPDRINGGERIAHGADETGLARHWVVHMNRDWSEDFLESDAPFAAVLMREEVERDAGERLPPTDYLNAHRWRFARAREPLGRAYVGCRDRAIWAGGDWSLGRQAEDAWRSGCAMADEIAAC